MLLLTDNRCCGSRVFPTNLRTGVSPVRPLVGRHLRKRQDPVDRLKLFVAVRSPRRPRPRAADHLKAAAVAAAAAADVTLHPRRIPPPLPRNSGLYLVGGNDQQAGTWGAITTSTIGNSAAAGPAQDAQYNRSGVEKEAPPD